MEIVRQGWCFFHPYFILKFIVDNFYGFKISTFVEDLKLSQLHSQVPHIPKIVSRKIAFRETWITFNS